MGCPMRTEERPDEPDPAEVQPTDNSSGVPVDLERVEQIEDDPPAADA
jgi:hypothetical protein